MTTTLTVPANMMNFAKGTVTALNDAITLLRMNTLGGVAVQLSGTWTGTVTFEATVDGTNWVTFFMTPSGSATDVGTATGNGAWSKPNYGYSALRVRISTLGTGTVGIAIRGVQQWV